MTRVYTIGLVCARRIERSTEEESPSAGRQAFDRLGHRYRAEVSFNRSSCDFVSPERSVDIDTELDLAFVEFLLERKGMRPGQDSGELGLPLHQNSCC
jgi:hypothetical protein